ncbi:rifin PIR protein, putative [Plasmodium reichenowi]|uniref:Rifin PIR protein, putative n=1 Tax=Plasmodium reichenowi TaxID=5854 RepID=A0A2P9DS64_PLARE|nr:rifin PIR protein, putative [Plasmodium reichenowi]
MKVHYINILLFALPLNILVTLYHVNIQKKSSITLRTPHSQTNRYLCECDLYMPNYDRDPLMKEVMDNFNKQTQERFEEYNEHMIKNRQKCKEQCDKEIQKIILKDKLEKELMDKFATLDTDIQSDDIPTCICEKSIAEKMEKGCLRCAQNLGGIVVPSSGVIGEIAAFAVKAWKTTEIAAATELAKQAGAIAGKAAGQAAGVEEVISGLTSTFSLPTINGHTLEKIITSATLKDHTILAGALKLEYQKTCIPNPDSDAAFCFIQRSNYSKVIDATTKSLVGNANKTTEAKTVEVTTSETAAAIKTSTEAIEAAITPYYTTIIASIIAIVVIILIMVIIYLILRNRRKKKMKKKLQYIKLLEE